MKVAGKDIDEWAEIIAEKRREFEKLPIAEQERLRQKNAALYDRWQAETDAMAKDEPEKE